MASLASYSFDRPFPQQFSLPHPMVIYMIKRQKSRRDHIKFMKLCKYTFAKNPIVPVSNMRGYPKNCPAYWTAKWKNVVKLNLQNGNFKLWIYGCTAFHCNVSQLAPKTYQCQSNVIIRSQVMSFDNFLLFTRGKHVYFYKNTVKYSDGSLVPFARILESLLHASRVDYRLSVKEAYQQSAEDIKDMAEVLLRPTNRMLSLSIYGLTEAFDVSMFLPFLLKEKNVHVFLKFEGKLSKRFKRKLNDIVDQMLAAFPPQFFPVAGCPGIYYSGLDRKRRKKLTRVHLGEVGMSI